MQSKQQEWQAQKEQLIAEYQGEINRMTQIHEKEKLNHRQRILNEKNNNLTQLELQKQGEIKSLKEEHEY